MDASAWLVEVKSQYRSYKNKCERSLAQVPEDRLFDRVGGIPLSLAALFKHLGGNHRSRWRDFLTSDGEKSDRDRDSEFVVEGDTPESIRAIWDEGWSLTFEALDALEPGRLDQSVTIRGEPHSVAQAIQRNLTHLAYHTGQVVQLARHFAGDNWVSLSVPVGASEAHNAQMREKWGEWNG